MDIQKVSVYDPRVVQPRPGYAVDKGALSITNSPFSAIGSSSSQMTFNVQAPSLNVYMDRKLEWTTGVRLQLSVVVSPGIGGLPSATRPATGASTPVVVFGRDIALAPHPLHALVSTMTATINDAVVSQNTADVLYEVARLVDTTPSKLSRTTPSYLDKYVSYNSAVGAINSPLASYFDATDYENLPNGAFWNVKFQTPTGADIPNSATTYSDGVGNDIACFNGIPCLSPAGTGATTGTAIGTYPIFLFFQATEKLFLSPFIWNEVVGDEVGLFGLNNLQLVFNFQQPSRLVRIAPLASGVANPRSIASTTFIGADPFVSPKVNVLFLTPPLDINLPSRSVLPYMEFPRYVSTNLGTALSGSTLSVITNTITLPVIPDMLILYAKPATYTADQGDYYLPIRSLSVNFDNYSGLLASHTTEQLYAISVKNGLRMDWNTWNGLGKVVNVLPTLTTIANFSASTPLVGGFLVLKMGEDIPLQAGLASGVVGNYTLQINATLFNQTTASVAPQFYVIAVNSGFFETQAGSSRIIRGVLTEQDVIQAPPSSDMARSQMERIVGGGFLSKLGSALTRATSMVRDIASNPAVQAGVRAGLSRSSNPLAQQVASFIPGAGVAGGASASAMRRGGRRTGGRAGADMSALM